MVFSILFGHIVELCSNVWSNDVRLFSIMFGSLDWLPKFCLAGNYVGRFLDLWFLLLLFISNFVRLYGIMFGKWAGASREETYGQSWDEYIFRASIIYSNYYQCLCCSVQKEVDKNKSWKARENVQGYISISISINTPP